MLFWCPECKLELSPEDFYINRRTSTGRTVYCKTCTRARNAQSRERRRVGAGIAPAERRKRQVKPLAPRAEKTCGDCKRTLPLEGFPRDKNRRDGRHGYCLECNNARSKESLKRLHGSTRTYHLKRRYGLTAEEVQELIDEQRGMCWICRTRPAAHVDHDHETGMVRAILCFTCNAGLGNFGEDVERMKAAIIYLEIFQAAARAQARRTA